MSRPRIGVPQPGGFFNPAFFLINVGIFLGGGRPCKITAQTPRDEAFDGIVLGGGTDVFPELFREKPIPDYLYDRERDEMDMRWLEVARDRALPVLAICRGAQMLNVMNGGSLHMQVREAYEDAIYPEGYWSYLVYRKTMLISSGSRLEQILNTAEYRVNSMHKQAIASVGQGLHISGRENNGVVQAIEKPGDPFYLGVQFHPELMLHRRGCRCVFRAFVEACRSRRSEPG